MRCVIHLHKGEPEEREKESERESARESEREREREKERERVRERRDNDRDLRYAERAHELLNLLLVAVHNPVDPHKDV